MKKGLRQVLWLGISVVLVGLIAYHLSRGGEWRHFRWDRLWDSLLSANPAYLLAAILTTYTSYVVRAYRWGFFLDPIKKASLQVLFTGQIIGFAAIYLVGRPGEIVRPGYIAKRENVSYSAMAAVWLLERVYDTVFIALLFSLALFWISPSNEPGGVAAGLSAAHRVAWLTLFITGVFVALLIAFRFRSEKSDLRTPKLLRFLSPKRQHHFERFLRSFADGLGVIRNWKDLTASVASTALLWGVNVTFFWLVFRGMGNDVGRLSWMAAALVLFSGIMGMIVQIPGIGGGFQVVTIKTMTAFLGVGLEEAAGASILLWIMLVFPCVALGVILLLHEGLTIRKLESIAEEEERAMLQK